MKRIIASPADNGLTWEEEQEVCGCGECELCKKWADGVKSAAEQDRRVIRSGGAVVSIRAGVLTIQTKYGKNKFRGSSIDEIADPTTDSFVRHLVDEIFDGHQPEFNRSMEMTE